MLIVVNVLRLLLVSLSFGGVLDNGADMALWTFGKACPKCGSTARSRIRRRLWMRLIPRSKFFTCEKCDRSYVSVLSSFSFRWSSGVLY